MPGECKEMRAKCQGNAGERTEMQGPARDCEGNIWEWVKCQGNAGKCLGNTWVCAQSARRMQVNI